MTGCSSSLGPKVGYSLSIAQGMALKVSLQPEGYCTALPQVAAHRQQQATAVAKQHIMST